MITRWGEYRRGDEANTNLVVVPDMTCQHRWWCFDALTTHVTIGYHVFLSVHDVIPFITAVLRPEHIYQLIPYSMNSIYTSSLLCCLTCLIHSYALVELCFCRCSADYKFEVYFFIKFYHRKHPPGYQYLLPEWQTRSNN